MISKEQATRESTVREIMAAVLGIPAHEITAATSPETVEAWDSILHINLILALQETFGVQFEPDEISTMLSYQEILRVLNRKVS